jgi:hypothetical protein
LTAGDHHIRVERNSALENAVLPPGIPAGEPLLLWEGPGIDRQPIPQSALSH